MQGEELQPGEQDLLSGTREEFRSWGLRNNVINKKNGTWGSGWAIHSDDRDADVGGVNSIGQNHGESENQVVKYCWRIILEREATQNSGRKSLKHKSRTNAKSLDSRDQNLPRVRMWHIVQH